MSEDYTSALPEWIVCSCGTKGPHPQQEGCPVEGTMIWDGKVIDETMLRVRYDDDPVISALLDHVKDLVWSMRASHVVMVHQGQYVQESDDRHARDIKVYVKDLADAQRRIDSLNSKIDLLETQAAMARVDKEKAVALNADAKKRLKEVMEKEVGWRAVIEELAVATGYWQDKPNAYGWSPEGILREGIVEHIKEGGRGKE